MLLDPIAILLIVAAGLYYSLGERTDAAALVLALVPVLGARWALHARSRSVLRRLARTIAPSGEMARDGQVPPAALALRAQATPFQRRAGVLFRRWTVVAIAVAVALLAASLVNGEPWVRAGLAAVTFAMAALPTEFPIALTLFASTAAWRLVARGMTVLRWPALETLGSTTVIAIDDAGPSMADSVAECRRAGIRVVMVTGDDKFTAGAAHHDASIITGEELDALPETEREARIQRTTIFARMSPEQKFLIVDGLQRAGAVVAMTGDGISDGAALRRADVGIVGARGADAARATADVVLHDDSLMSILAGICAGRHMLQSSQRALLYLVAFHLPIVLLAVVAPLAGVPLVLLPIHLVWLGLLALAVMAGIFVAEAPSPAVMQTAPRKTAAPLLPSAALWRSVLSGGVVALGAWVTYAWRLPEVGEAEARAMALIVLLGGNQILMLVERLALPGLRVELIPRARLFWFVWCASALSLGVVLYVPALARLFGVAPPAVAPTFAALALGMLGVGWRLAAAPRRSTQPVDAAR